MTCGVRGIDQEAKLLAARAEERLTRGFGSGTSRQGRCRQERGVEVDRAGTARTAGET